MRGNETLAEGATDALRLGAATTTDQREAVFRLRYRVFAEEMGQRLFGVDAAKKTITDDLDGVGTILTVTAGKDIVASVRTVRASDAAGRRPDYPKLFHLDALPKVTPR